MDQLGLDAAYRERTHCTLYTLELHMHYLHEVKATDELRVATSRAGLRPQAHPRGAAISSVRAFERAGGGRRAHAAARASGREAGERRLPRRGRGPARGARSCPPPSAAARRSWLAQDRNQAAVSRMPRRRHTTADRAAQHRAHRRQRVDGRRGGRQRRGRLPGQRSGASTRRKPSHLGDARTTARSPSCPARPTPRSSRCRITRRPAVAGALAARGAGGFVCFTAGFSELGTEAGHAS